MIDENMPPSPPSIRDEIESPENVKHMKKTKAGKSKISHTDQENIQNGSRKVSASPFKYISTPKKGLSSHDPTKNATSNNSKVTTDQTNKSLFTFQVNPFVKFKNTPVKHSYDENVLYDTSSSFSNNETETSMADSNLRTHLAGQTPHGKKKANLSQPAEISSSISSPTQVPVPAPSAPVPESISVPLSTLINTQENNLPNKLEATNTSFASPTRVISNSKSSIASFTVDMNNTSSSSVSSQSPVPKETPEMSPSTHLHSLELEYSHCIPIMGSNDGITNPFVDTDTIADTGADTDTVLLSAADIPVLHRAAVASSVTAIPTTTTPATPVNPLTPVVTVVTVAAVHQPSTSGDKEKEPSSSPTSSALPTPLVSSTSTVNTPAAAAAAAHVNTNKQTSPSLTDNTPATHTNARRVIEVIEEGVSLSRPGLHSRSARTPPSSEPSPPAIALTQTHMTVSMPTMRTPDWVAMLQAPASGLSSLYSVPPPPAVPHASVTVPSPTPFIHSNEQQQQQKAAAAHTLLLSESMYVLPGAAADMSTITIETCEDSVITVNATATATAAAGAPLCLPPNMSPYMSMSSTMTTLPTTLPTLSPNVAPVHTCSSTTMTNNNSVLSSPYMNSPPAGMAAMMPASNRYDDLHIINRDYDFDYDYDYDYDYGYNNESMSESTLGLDEILSEMTAAAVAVDNNDNNNSNSSANTRTSISNNNSNSNSNSRRTQQAVTETIKSHTSHIHTSHTHTNHTPAPSSTTHNRNHTHTHTHTPESMVRVAVPGITHSVFVHRRHIINSDSPLLRRCGGPVRYIGDELQPPTIVPAGADCRSGSGSDSGGGDEYHSYIDDCYAYNGHIANKHSKGSSSYNKSNNNTNNNKDNNNSNNNGNDKVAYKSHSSHSCRQRIFNDCSTDSDADSDSDSVVLEPDDHQHKHNHARVHHDSYENGSNSNSSDDNDNDNDSSLCWSQMGVDIDDKELMVSALTVNKTTMNKFNHHHYHYNNQFDISATATDATSAATATATANKDVIIAAAAAASSMQDASFTSLESAGLDVTTLTMDDSAVIDTPVTVTAASCHKQYGGSSCTSTSNSTMDMNKGILTKQHSHQPRLALTKAKLFHKSDTTTTTSAAASASSTTNTAVTAAHTTTQEQVDTNIKEISFTAPVGESTETSLILTNKRHKTLNLLSSTILVRYEPCNPLTNSVNITHSMDNQANQEISINPFHIALNQEFVILKSNEELSLKITFTAPRDKPMGVYSGVLKITSNGKSFITLLRGVVSAAVRLPQSQPQSESSSGSGRGTPLAAVTAVAVVNGTYIEKPISLGYSSNTQQQHQHKQQQQKSKHDSIIPTAIVTTPATAAVTDAAASAHGSSSPLYQKQMWIKNWLEKLKLRDSLHSTGSGSGSGSSLLTALCASNKSSKAYDEKRKSLLYVSKEKHTHSPPSSPSPLLSTTTANTTVVSNTTAAVSATRYANRYMNMISPLMTSASSGTSITFTNTAANTITTGTTGAGTGTGTAGRSVYAVNYPTARYPAYKDIAAATNNNHDTFAHMNDHTNHTTAHSSDSSASSDHTAHAADYNHMNHHTTTHHTTSHASHASDHINNPISHSGGHGLFFRRSSVNFGAADVGTLSRMRIELCNATDHQITVYVGDPKLPFVVLHNEVTIRPRCYVRLPVRFVPVVGPKEFKSQLTACAQTVEGSFQTSIHLIGSSVYLS